MWSESRWGARWGEQSHEPRQAVQRHDGREPRHGAAAQASPAAASDAGDPKGRIGRGGRSGGARYSSHRADLPLGVSPQFDADAAPMQFAAERRRAAFDAGDQEGRIKGGWSVGGGGIGR